MLQSVMLPAPLLMCCPGGRAADSAGVAATGGPSSTAAQTGPRASCKVRYRIGVVSKAQSKHHTEGRRAIQTSRTSQHHCHLASGAFMGKGTPNQGKGQRWCCTGAKVPKKCLNTWSKLSRQTKGMILWIRAPALSTSRSGPAASFTITWTTPCGVP